MGLGSGIRDGGTQFRRLDRHSGTLYINPFTVLCNEMVQLREW
jgi:hypothetical protein